MNTVSEKPAAQGTFSITVDGLDAAGWSAVLGQFDDATIYQSWSYGAVHWSADQLSHLVLKRDGKIVGAAQLRLVRLPVIGKGIAYLRWGPVFRPKGEAFDPEILRRTLAAIKDEYVLRRGLMLRFLPAAFEADPFAAEFKSACAALGIVKNEEVRDLRTIRVDLTPPLDAVRKRLGPKWRNKLNGAERNGLTIVEGNSVEHYDKFLAAYREMMARKNFDTTVDVAEFGRMQAELPSDFRLQVFLCEKDGKVLNALVVTAVGDTAIYLLGATSDEGLKLKGAYLLQWRAMQWLKERGCRWYELGGIDPVNNPGVYEFKSGFGGEETMHLGTYESHDAWASAFCVRTGERAKTFARKLRSWNANRTAKNGNDRQTND